MLKSDLHCVTRAWSKWLTDKNAVLKGDIKPNRGRKKKFRNRRRLVHSVLKKESFNVASDHSGNWLQILIRRFRYQAKSRKYQGVFEVKSRVKTWQVRGIWSQQLEH